MLSDTEIVDEDKNKDTRRAYTEARAVLADIVRGLPAPLPYNFDIKVLTASNGNASALPGGIILVDRDLFKKGADRDLAYFKITHEVAHVLQRHQTRAYQAKLIDGMDSLQGFETLLTSAKEPSLNTLLAFGTTIKKLLVNFSEAQEMQADSCAVRMLSKCTGNTQALAGKLRKLDKWLGPAVHEVADGPQDQTLQAQFKYLGDGVTERHPNTNKRKANLHLAYAAVITPTKLAQAPGQADQRK